ncbi:MAG: sulfurtransferase TusA family protein, partial [Actinomycetota bacterium]|nr:sulfurtransferase TusA family protein [Actinomycetota bacterium]
MSASVDLGPLGLDRGGHLLLQRALARIGPGDRLVVRGTSPELGVHLRAWCRDRGHRFSHNGSGYWVVRGTAEDDRWQAAARA